MNQKQREFLISAVEKRYRVEVDALKKRKPIEPNLNNYLTAAILDGSFEMRDMNSIRSAVRERVITLGQDETLLKSSTSRSWRDKDNEKKFIQIPANLLFVYPPAYQVCLDEYQAALAQWEEESNALDASFEAMKIKVQLGSDAALESLIDQADQLCSMSLTASTRLLIAAPSKSDFSNFKRYNKTI